MVTGPNWCFYHAAAGINPGDLRDYSCMDCDVAREALSARIDGEREPVPAARVDEHLLTCADCRDWYYRARDVTQHLRDLSGQQRPAMSAVADAPRVRRARQPVAVLLRRALAVVGVAQIVLAVVQTVGVATGLPTGLHATHLGGHLLNESTAWSVALGVAMVVTAVWPVAAAGLSTVLVGFTVVLTGFVVADAFSAAVTPLRALSHLPVLAGAVLALLVYRAHRADSPGPDAQSGADTEQITLPDNASRGRRRGHLWPSDGAA
jgi:predicted anti-sigma-YlaC factor YlaD